MKEDESKTCSSMEENVNQHVKANPNTTRVGCLGRMCSKRNKMSQVVPASEHKQFDDVTEPQINATTIPPPSANLTDHVTSESFILSKIDVSVAIDETAPASATIYSKKQKVKERHSIVKKLVNNNNNNENTEQSGEKSSNDSDERIDDSCRTVSNIGDTEPSSSTDTTLFKVVDSSPSQTESAQCVTSEKIQSRQLPTLQTSRDVLQRERRDQEEILYELQKEGILTDPRITIGGVSYQIPKLHGKKLYPSIPRLSSMSTLSRIENNKMFRAMERRDLAEVRRLEEIGQKKKKRWQVLEEMECAEDLKRRRTSVKLITDLSKIATNRETKETDWRLKCAARTRHRKRVRNAKKMTHRKKRDKTQLSLVEGIVRRSHRPT